MQIDQGNDAVAPNEQRSLLLRPAKWGGAWLDHVQCGPSDSMETSVYQHIVSLYVSRPKRLHVSIEGVRRTQVLFFPGSVSLVPAFFEVRGSSAASTEWIHLHIDPSFAADDLTTQHGGRLTPFINSRQSKLSEYLIFLLKNSRNGCGIDPILGETVIAELLEVLFGLQRKTANLTSKELIKLDHFITENLDQRLSLDELSQVVLMDKFSFIRAFKIGTGKTPHRYIVEKRVRHSEDLLQRTNLPIVHIAFCCGFSSASHFSDVFRKFTGVTPLQWRLGVDGSSTKRFIGPS